MSQLAEFGVDDFPCGCIVTDASRRLIFANKYIYEEFGWSTDRIQRQSIEALMSRATHLFCESYLYPILIQDGKCEEAQLTFVSPNGVRTPVIANVRQTLDNKYVWSVFSAVNRDRLNQELVEARNLLEEQTRQLRKLSHFDDLTGLMNRRAFNEAVGKSFVAADRTGDQITLMILDIDDFKKINDTYGHNFGDDVLRKVGTGLAAACHPSQQVARFGGEEFIFALCGVTCEDANVFAKRIHEAIRVATMDILPTTVSIGSAARYGRFGPSYIELLSQADKALYEAKETGKNKTVFGGNIRLVSDVVVA